MHIEPIHTALVVILVNYRSADDTLSCIESIRQQDPAANPFIVVVDNSLPNEPALDALTNMEYIQVLYNSENLGFGRANNLGIEWAKTHLTFDYLLLLNNDTIIAPSALSILMDCLASEPNADLATGKILYYDQPELVWYGGADIHPVKGWPEIVDLNLTASKDGANRARTVDFASGCYLLFNQRSLELLHGFDPGFFMYCEDLELCLRATKMGIRIQYAPSSVIYHKVHGSSQDKSDAPKNLHVRNPSVHFLFYHLKKNQFLAVRKHVNGWPYFRFLLYFWARYHYFVIKMLLHGRLRIAATSWRTKWAILQIILGKNQQAR